MLELKEHINNGSFSFSMNAYPEKVNRTLVTMGHSYNAQHYVLMSIKSGNKKRHRIKFGHRGQHI